MGTMGTTWGRGNTWTVALHTDDRGARVFEGLDGYRSAEVDFGAAATRPGELILTLVPVVESPGADAGLDPSKVVAIQVFNSAQDRPLEDFAVFERRIIERYYGFMCQARWHYAGLYRLSASEPFPYSRAEPYLIDAQTIDAARALNELTTPEPPDILEIYKECSSYKDKNPRGTWLWFGPHA